MMFYIAVSLAFHIFYIKLYQYWQPNCRISDAAQSISFKYITFLLK